MATAVFLAGSVVGTGSQEAITPEAKAGLLWNQQEQMLEQGLEADLFPRREPCQQPVPPPCSQTGPTEAGCSELQCLEGEFCPLCSGPAQTKMRFFRTVRQTVDFLQLQGGHGGQEQSGEVPGPVSTAPCPRAV